jgi:hypothetical protein
MSGADKKKGKDKSSSNKTVGGVKVNPTLYVGHRVGHGRYIAAKLEGSGKLVINERTGKPVPYGSIVSS